MKSPLSASPPPLVQPGRRSFHRRLEDFARSALTPFFRTDLCLVDAYHAAPAGVSHSARLFWRLLESMPELRTRRVLPGLRHPLDLGSVAITLWLANARDLPRLHRKLSWLARRSRRDIGYWYFELDRLPPRDAEAASLVSEVWVASEFVAGAVRASCDLPVTVIPPPVLLDAGLASLDRTEAGDGPPAACRGCPRRFLVSFDAYSSVERKNPWMAIEAFRRVFGGDSERTLTVRVSRAEGLTEELRRRLQAEESEQVQILFETFGRIEDAHLFMARHDVYLSPHRSEGLGLHLVEAILLGIPVIATGYGGNTDFCPAAGVDRIDFDLVDGEDPQGLYSGAFKWAQPRRDHLCSQLEAIGRRPPEEQAERCRVAREAVAVHFDTERICRLVRERLAAGGRSVAA